MSELDDLLGDAAEPVRVISGLRDSGRRARLGSQVPADVVDLRTEQLHNVVGGVSVPWLMTAFRMSRTKVMKLLADGGVQPIGTHRNGGTYYDLPDAASCLVTPKQNFDAFLKTLKSTDLPAHMQDNYWAAKLKEQKWRVQAGDLWPTAAVMQVFGDTFKMIKNKVQLWPDTIAERANLNDRQRELLHDLLFDLLKELSKELTDDATINETRSQLADIDDLE